MAASTLNRILTGTSRMSPDMALRLSEGSWPFSGELACHAVQPRSLASQAACETWQGRKSPVNSGLTGALRRTQRNVAEGSFYALGPRRSSISLDSGMCAIWRTRCVEFDSPETPVLRFNLCVFAQLARGSRYGG